MMMLPQAKPVSTSSGKYLYFAGYDSRDFSNAIFPFEITGTSGQLTPLKDYPYRFSEGHISGFLMDSLNRFLFVGLNGTSNMIQPLPIDGGGLLQLGPAYSEGTPGSLSLQAVDPGGKFLYAWGTYPAGIGVFVYAINPNTGALSNVPESPFLVVPYRGPTNSPFLQVLADSSGKHVYFYYTGTPDPAGPSVSNLYIFAMDSATGKLTQTPASPFAMPETTIGVGAPLKFSPNGNFLYVPQRSSDSSSNINFGIGVFTVNQTDGSISPNAVSSIPAPVVPFVLPDPTGNVLLMGPGGTNSRTMWSYTVNNSTGILTSAQGSPFFANDPYFETDSYGIVRIP
jgi:6-phosphogluconolactonase (cycloisomerase 2 family)